ncbi:IclR family transcriptional regulator [Sulfuritalea sp.]|uniref:IclR family transcriptional regulator n=1 Tax=Sulfuritalea sp. TaxID=2480090 RepID=UPI0025E63721|nr:IclR family transcriptional regulator [Sulfuritalea sp.]
MPTPRAEAAAEPRAGIQVIERMMKLLDVLSYHPDPVSLKQLALETGLHPSTAHRILAAMSASGFVERADPGTYRLGIRLLELGNVVKSRISIGKAAMPLMERLHREIGESVNLGVRQGDEIVYVERTSSGRSSIRVVHLVGARAPLHVTAVGKLYLAEDGPQKLREYARRTGLPGYTPTSLTTVAALERDVDRARRHGIAFDNEEIEQGLRCVAAPVRDDSGELVAGLSVSAPAERHNPDWIERVKQTADAISLAIGYQAPKPTPKTH